MTRPAEISYQLWWDHDPELEYHEWILTDEKVKADKMGRQNHRMTLANWLKIRCNNPDCPGVGIVNTLDIAAGMDIGGES